MKKKNFARLTTVIMTLSLLLTTVFGLVPYKTYAENNDGLGIRFKQVEAGTDFAVALTYDNEVYAWSLLSNGGNMNPDDNPATLGAYYPTEPTKLDFKFYIMDYDEDGRVTPTENKPGGALDDDFAVQIATSKDSAAILTNQKYIYTWGCPSQDANYSGFPSSTAGNGGYVLLRQPGDSTMNVSKYNPGIIGYYDTNMARDFSLLSLKPDALNSCKLKGGENNFMLQFTKNSVNMFYAWGSSLYKQLPGINFTQHEYVSAGVYNLGTQNHDFYLGGNTLAILSNEGATTEGKLYFRGKNYYVPSTAVAVTLNASSVSAAPFNSTGGAGGSTNTSFKFNAGSTEYTFTDALVGSGVSGSSAPGLSTGADSVFAQQGTTLYQKGGEAVLLDSFGESNNNISLQNKIALGNGYGYGVSGGSVYFWGNNYNGQMGGNNVTKHIATPTAITGIAGTPVALAASKTLSGTPILKNGAETTSVASLSSNQLTFNSGYVDATNYISASLTNSGGSNPNIVYAWANNIALSTSLNDIFKTNFGVGKDAKNQIVNIVGGYGENLFALSNIGKLYHVSKSGTSFEVKLYDHFKSSATNENVTSITDITNWAVESSNKINFKMSNGTERAAANRLSATFRMGVASVDIPNDFYLADGTTKATHDKVINVNGKDGIDSNNGSQIHYKNNVKTDNIGDQYRFMVDNSQLSQFNDANKSFVAMEGVTNFDAKFKFYIVESSWAGGLATLTSEADATLIKQYIDYEFVYSDMADSIGIKIYPKKSTKNKKIIVKYAVGRFDQLRKNTGGSYVITNETFYDYKLSSIEVSIDNTLAESKLLKSHLPLIGEDTTSNSTIPLLDPNNPNNRYYSLSAMDVSTGLKELSKLVAAGTSSSGDSETSINNLFLDQIKLEDKGFPSIARKTSAYLDYFGCESYFNDTYKFFTRDRDGDKVVITSATVLNNMSQDAFSTVGYNIHDVTVLIPVGAGLNDAKLSLFNNLYGLTVVLDNSNPNDLKLSVTYQVITLEAKKSTNTVVYANNNVKNVDTTKSVSDSYTVNVVFEEYGYDASGNPVAGKNDRVNSNYLPVHSQAGMLLKDHETVYGKNDANRYEFNKTISNKQVGKMGEDGKITINLADYFYDTTNMIFYHKTISEGGETILDDYAAFARSFQSIPCDVTLNKSVMTLVPHAGGTQYFTLDVLRYTSSNNTSVFTDAETMHLEFVIEIAPQVFSKKNVSRTLALSGDAKVIRLSDYFEGNASLMEISVASSDNPSVAQVIVADDKREFKIQPLISGVVTILYRVEYYGEEIEDSFNVTVKSLVNIKDTINLIDESQVHVSKLISTIITDTPGGMNIDSSKLVTTAEDVHYMKKNSVTGDWDASGSPLFIKTVKYEKDRGIFLIQIADEYTSSGDDDNYKIVFKFTHSVNGETYEVAVPVKPQKKFLKTPENENLLLKFNVKDRLMFEANDNKFGFVSSGGDKSIKVTKDYLIDIYLQNNPTANISKRDYVINLASPATDEATQYFTVGRTNDYITIEPDFSTVKSEIVDVSIAPKNSLTLPSYVFSFEVNIEGIFTTLPKARYNIIFIVAFFSSLAFLMIIFIIRMAVYWKKKADQKKIIKKNQMLIKMRDKMHNKSQTATREQLVKTKLKMEDPKYAKMFTQMRKEKEEQTGIILDNSIISQKAENKLTLDKNKKKKKGGKKSIEELKAELEAKKAAFNQMQMGNVGSNPMIEGVMFDPNMNYSDQLTREDVESQIKAKIAADDGILFDVEPINPEDMNNN